MTTATALFLYVLAIACISLIIYSISVTRLHRRWVNSLPSYAKVTVFGDVGYYKYQLDHNHHLVEIDGCDHRVSFMDIQGGITL